MSKTIGIAGLGWLGKPLAQHFITLGYKVKGTVTTINKAEELQKKGFDVYPLEINETGISGEPKAFLKGCDVVVILIPPGLRRHTGVDHVAKMKHLLQQIEKRAVERVILVSSTSVYDDSQGNVTEKDIPKPQNDAGKQLFEVEQLFFNAPSLSTSIVRFGGLMGGSRQPVRYLAGRTDLQNGNAPVNLINRRDCIQVLSAIVRQEAYGHIFNAVHPEHPLKKDFYRQQAEQLQLLPPTYVEDGDSSVYKKVDSVRLRSVLNYTFDHPLIADR